MLTFKSDIPHTPAKSSEHDSYKLNKIFQFLFSKTATKNIYHDQYITKLLYYKKTSTNSLEYPNANPQFNNNNDAKHSKRSKMISKIATLIQKIKKATTTKLQKLD